MTILASTETHLVEYEFGQLTIARRSDGHCIAFEGRRVAGEFRDCLKTHSPERVIAVYLKMNNDWQPLYKPSHLPRQGPFQGIEQSST